MTHSGLYFKKIILTADWRMTGGRRAKEDIKRNPERVIDVLRVGEMLALIRVVAERWRHGCF